MSSADTTETKDTKKKRTRKPRTTKSKTKKSEETIPTPAETIAPTTTITEIAAPAEQETAPAPVEEIVPETEEKVETEDVVPQVDLPKFEKSLAYKITQKFGSKVEVAYIKQDRKKNKKKKKNIKDVALYKRDELNFEHAESVSGVD